MIVKTISRLFILCILLMAESGFATNYMSQKEFLRLAQKTPQSASNLTAKSLWLDDYHQTLIKEILEHKYPKLRLKYWISQNPIDSQQTQTVWFLEKIGKERPISFAVSVINHQIDLIKVLAFRESRGGEIRIQSFTEQFKGVELTDKKRLNRNIDGITGATMSVNAMKKISRLALLLHKEVSSPQHEFEENSE